MNTRERERKGEAGTGGELVEEAPVLGPEEADIRDVKEHHGQPLQAQPKGPTDVALRAVTSVLMSEERKSEVKECDPTTRDNG
jgi:hypothetical protein